ncbi:MAG: [protein-PII] uridylyltransferase [Gammaproteobacteria bacterium RIFCSPLOWO2_02_FULL_56_15]|nr:MAG: [protein-PII] uridylyltransferase [Gammaproteobacteria bacterium RIFCSPLOWO2_02_FULL_56_15]
MWYDNIGDPALFNREEFLQALQSSDNRIEVFRDRILNCNQYLIEEFDKGHPIKQLLYKRAWFIDQLLTHAWQSFLDEGNLALVAVGGYGRGELHPSSDIDIMILTKSRIKAATQKQIESYITFLWDVGFNVGHSVRSIKDCYKEARADVTITTNLMESRLITGERNLFNDMIKVTGPGSIWSPRKFFQAKLAEQMARHRKYDDTDYKLEPNIKEGPGGLRDIQTIDWVAKRQFGATRLSQLVDHGFLTTSEYNTLAAGRAFLWHVRFALHVMTGRREDRLLFDHQRSVAKVFGYESEDNSAVEQFMKNYYKTVRELNRLNEMLLQHFQEAILYARRKERIIPVNKRFQIRNDFLEVCNDRIFKLYPMALLELFLIMQQHPQIKGVRASTIRLIRENLRLIDTKFRNDLSNQTLFLEITRQPKRVGHELRRMHRYGVLGAYLPVFARIEGLMQFDLFHIYTVDEHILFVIQNMRLLGQEEYLEKFPHCRKLLRSIPKQELLYLAGIFHDIAKGRDEGSHSELGAEDALEFCRKHRMPEFDCKLVAWLVRNHLIMSRTAQRKDINAPDVINTFAAQMGDVMHLQYLYLLTLADITGTNPKIWNNWKASLIAELFLKTLRALRRGLENPIDKNERIREVKNQALELIGDSRYRGMELEDFWSSLGDDYFIRYSAEEIAWQTQAIVRAKENKLPIISIQEATIRGGTGIFIYMHNHKGIFSRATSAMGHLGLNIVDARIIISAHGYTLDTYIVLEESGENVHGRERLKEIRDVIKQALGALDKPVKLINRIKSRKIRNFPIPSQVNFSQDQANNHTIMEVIATDRPGFLSRIGLAFEDREISLKTAKVATFGERVEDIFFITDHNNNMITDEKRIQALQDSIIESLEQF